MLPLLQQLQETKTPVAKQTATGGALFSTLVCLPPTEGQGGGGAL